MKECIEIFILSHIMALNYIIAWILSTAFRSAISGSIWKQETADPSLLAKVQEKIHRVFWQKKRKRGNTKYGVVLCVSDLAKVLEKYVTVGIHFVNVGIVRKVSCWTLYLTWPRAKILQRRKLNWTWCFFALKRF